MSISLLAFDSFSWRVLSKGISQVLLRTLGVYVCSPCIQTCNVCVYGMHTRMHNLIAASLFACLLAEYSLPSFSADHTPYFSCSRSSQTNAATKVSRSRWTWGKNWLGKEKSSKQSPSHRVSRQRSLPHQPLSKFPIRVSSRFMFVVYGFELLVRVWCVHSVGRCSSLLFRLCFFTVPQGSTLYIFLEVSFTLAVAVHDVVRSRYCIYRLLMWLFVFCLRERFLG